MSDVVNSRVRCLFPLLTVVCVVLADSPGAWAQVPGPVAPEVKGLWDSLWDLLKAAIAQAGVEASLGITFTVVAGWLVAKKRQLESRITGPDDDLSRKPTRSVSA